MIFAQVYSKLHISLGHPPANHSLFRVHWS